MDDDGEIDVVLVAFSLTHFAKYCKTFSFLRKSRPSSVFHSAKCDGFKGQRLCHRFLPVKSAYRLFVFIAAIKAVAATIPQVSKNSPYQYPDLPMSQVV